jgi:4-amino-4-deoxy-L-arabinose transferase-like glycosyltransferase
MNGECFRLEGTSWRWLAAATLLLSAIMAIVGGGESLPLDGHELFVARGTEEMLERQSYLVPFINGEPRLKKPPLNNWLIVLAHLGRSHSHVTALEARLPSMAAGVALTGITLALGTVLMDRRRALLGALLTACSSAYLSYTHSARPEMLFAALSMAGLLGFVLADRRLREGRPAWACSAWAWLAWALATLTKGPHFPLIFLVAIVVWQWRQAGWRQALRVLRLDLGLPLFVLVCGSWAAMVFWNVPNVMDAWRHEAAMRFDGRHSSWLSRLNPYYLYRTAALVAPWSALFPLALLWPWLSRRQRRDPAAGLWWTVATSIAVMSLLSRPRWYYLLPILAPLTLLMSDALLAQLEAMPARWRRLAAVVLAGHAVALAVLACSSWNQVEPTYVLRGVAAALALLAGAWVARKVWQGAEGAAIALATLTAAGGLCFASVAYDGGWWEPARQIRRDFALKVAQLVPADQPLLGWRGDDWIEEAYAADRIIAQADEIADLEAALQKSPVVWVLAEVVEPGRKRALPVTDTPVLITELADDDRDDDVKIALWQVERADLPLHSMLNRLCEAGQAGR